MKRREFLAGATAAAAAAACSSSRSPDASSPQPSTTTTTSSAALPTGFVSSGRRTSSQVALTFHVSGDRALATTMLDLLRQRQVVITAFMVGTFVEQNADLMPRFVADGHEIANHTYRHLTFAALPANDMTIEVTKCRDALTKSVGTSGHLFRPSGTANGIDAPSKTELDTIAAAGYQTVVGYDVDPADYADPGAKAVVDRTLAVVRPGSIVSLHFGHAGTIDALPHILDGIDARGLQPVTTSALLRT